MAFGDRAYRGNAVPSSIASSTAQAEAESAIKNLNTRRDPGATWVDADVQLERDVVLEPGCYLLGRTRVGAGAVIETGCRLDGVTVAAGERVPAHTRRSAE